MWKKVQILFTYCNFPSPNPIRMNNHVKMGTFFKKSNTCFKTPLSLQTSCMYYCIFDIGLASTYSSVVLESKDCVYMYIAFEFWRNFLNLIFDEKLNKTIDKLKTDLLLNIYYAAIFKVLNQFNYSWQKALLRQLSSLLNFSIKPI